VNGYKYRNALRLMLSEDEHGQFCTDQCLMLVKRSDPA